MSKITIALYKSIEYESVTVDHVESWIEESEKYIRVTEPQEVELIDLPASETVPAEVAALENVKAEAHAEYAILAARLDEKISKLLAIEDQSDG